MKMNYLSKWVFIFGATIVLTSCGNSIEKDAKKMAKMACEIQIDPDPKKMLKLAEMEVELQKKYYGKDEESEKFTEAYFKALENCEL